MQYVECKTHEKCEHMYRTKYDEEKEVYAIMESGEHTDTLHVTRRLDREREDEHSMLKKAAIDWRLLHRCLTKSQTTEYVKFHRKVSGGSRVLKVFFPYVVRNSTQNFVLIIIIRV
jgi:predicted metal-dependent peptidase